MFQSDKYLKKDREFIYQFIQNHPFATFITSNEDIIATHIPILIDKESDELILFGHIANLSEQLKDLLTGAKALLIFKEPDSYVSSSWYAEKDISTWDYSAVHINCTMQIQSDTELIKSLKKLVFHFKKKQENPVYYEDLPEPLLKDHLPKITGFWLHPHRIQGISKLQQWFEKEDVFNISEKLESTNNCQ